MRKTTPMTLGEIWDDFVKSSPAVARKLAEARALEAWPSVVDPMVAHFTTSVKLENGVYTARIGSASARSEAFMWRAQLADALNEAAGMRVVRTVIIK